MKLKQDSFKTVSNLYGNYFKTVLFQFHFNCADSLTHYCPLFSVWNIAMHILAKFCTRVKLK